MKVVFLKAVKNVGKPGEVKEVSPGYASNFLIPKGFAIPAGKDALNRLKHEDEHRKKASDAERARERAALSAISGKRVIILVKAHGGKLFGSVHPRDIVSACAAAGIQGLSEKSIIMEKPIREIGEFPVKVRLGSAKAEFRVDIRAEEKEMAKGE
ncbi:MAG: 50S ribosomal protein L9 [Candidatus Moranbacteria bacterium]|nr:50S ribosomal protein L9 [Candidatus Moranbacteria bacterium]